MNQEMKPRIPEYRPEDKFELYKNLPQDQDITGEIIRAYPETADIIRDIENPNLSAFSVVAIMSDFQQHYGNYDAEGYVTGNDGQMLLDKNGENVYFRVKKDKKSGKVSIKLETGLQASDWPKLDEI